MVPTRRHRVQALLHEVDRLSKMSRADFEDLLLKLQPTVNYNKDWIQSRKFKSNLRKQSEYALGLANQKVYDYTDLVMKVEEALAAVHAPKCDYLPNPTKCNPVCGYNILSKVSKDGLESDEPEEKSDYEQQAEDIESGHKLVFENSKGEVIAIGNQVIESPSNSGVDVESGI
jgi:hypothetical protein